jgi:membrane-associated protein
MLAALINVPAAVGYPLLFVLVAAESAGALVPGETSLIVAAALAAQGRLSLPFVIAVAASAAIIGDNTGYLIGRRGLRRLLDRPGRRSTARRRLVERGETFFARRGAAAVFFARWLPGLRVVTSWLAGAERMPWRRFLLWNALGGTAWAATIGALAYLLGRSGSGSLGAIGFAGLGLAGLVYLVAHIRRRLTMRRKPPADPTAGQTVLSTRPTEEPSRLAGR